MLLADRPQFEDQLGALCAGFNVPMTDFRTEAYWRGLQKMQLGQFARTVEAALGSEGPERIPTVPQCWNIWRHARTRLPAQQVEKPADQPTYDYLHGFGQRCLMHWLKDRGGVPDAVLPKVVAEKNRMIEGFRSIATEAELTAEEVRVALFAAFKKAAA